MTRQQRRRFGPGALAASIAALAPVPALADAAPPAGATVAMPAAAATPDAATAPAPATAPDPAAASLPQDLTELSLAELMDIEVTSVSKRSEPLARAAAAIHVLTGEQIRRSGARSIAEALRMVPGMHVARTSENTLYYAVTARGFNANASDKLEVFLDGRSVYSPLFSGVYWDALDTYLADIDRIEVIRGPGAALWGANAVNGVINIVTKRAADTQGTQVIAGGGDEERAYGSVRTGGRVGSRGHVRAYAKAFDRDGAARTDGFEPHGDLRMQQGGLRLDMALSAAHDYTVTGDVYSGTRDSETGGIDLDGANLTGRWNWRRSEHSDLSFKAWVDHYERTIPQVYGERRTTVDLAFEHHLRLGSHDVLYGFGWRQSRARTGGPPFAFLFLPDDRVLETPSGFIQDQIHFAGGRGTLTLGSRFEQNTYTEFEVQPSVRLGWQVREHLYAWGAVSRAVRVPNQLDTDFAVFCTQQLVDLGVCPQVGIFPIGNPDFKSEELVAYELGLRWTDTALSADLALFHNDYDQLRTFENAGGLAALARNGMEGTGAGAEASFAWRARADLELRGSLSLLDLDLEPKPDSNDVVSEAMQEGTAPERLATFEVAWSPAPRWNLDANLRHVSELPAHGISDYTELGLRVAWRARPGLELSVTGSNLLEDEHVEFGPPIPGQIAVERAVRAEIEWRWD